MIERWRKVAGAVLADPARADVVVFGLIAAGWTIEFIGHLDKFHQELSPSRQTRWFFLTIPIVVVMLLRSRAPFTVFAFVAGMGALLIMFVGSGWQGFTSEWALYACIFAIASVRSIGWAAAAVVMGTLSWLPQLASYRCACMSQLFTFLTFAAVAGFSVQASRKLMAELRQQAEVLRTTRDERLRLALEQERSRVARDLHDVVAHGVTLMVVQAGAARMVAASDRLRADDALARVEATAGEALQELASLVELLGPDAPVAMASRPPPSGEAIPDLIEHERSAGLDVDLRIEGTSHPLDPAMEISLYRIVQEALTNVRKHAAGTRTRIALRYLPNDVEVDVTNTASLRATIDTVPGFGRGLIGVAERAALFGGEASAGPTPDGGFRVSARMPLEMVPA